MEKRKTRKIFKVKTPHGVFADGEWAAREDIPDVLMDRWEHRFFVEDGEIVEVEISNAEFIAKWLAGEFRRRGQYGL
jgi:hypothetical protein